MVKSCVHLPRTGIGENLHDGWLRKRKEAPTNDRPEDHCRVVVAIFRAKNDEICIEISRQTLQKTCKKAEIAHEGEEKLKTDKKNEK